MTDITDDISSVETFLMRWLNAYNREMFWFKVHLLLS